MNKKRTLLCVIAGCVVTLVALSGMAFANQGTDVLINASREINATDILGSIYVYSSDFGMDDETFLSIPEDIRWEMILEFTQDIAHQRSLQIIEAMSR